MRHGRTSELQTSGGGAATGFLTSDARAGSKTSALAMTAGLFFAFRAIFVLVTAEWLHVGTEPGVLVSLSMSLFLLLATLLQGFGGAAQRIRWAWDVRCVRWVAIYLGFSGCSLLWTGSSSPGASALYWCALTCDAAIVLVLFKGYEAQQAAHSLMKGFIRGACVLAAIAWVMPAAEDLRLGNLDYFNTNQIGNLCALSILLSSILSHRRDGESRFAVVFLTLTLFRSLSKSTLVALIAAQTYRLLRDGGMGRRKKLLLVLGVIVVTVLFWGLIDAYYVVYSTSGNQAETLTGRTAIWAWALDAAVSKPWIGNGIDAMWKVAPPFGGELFEARHAENEVLQQFFAYGVAGIVMLAGIYGSLWREFRSVRDRSERTAKMALLVYVLVRGLAEAEPFDLLLPLWMIAMLALLVERESSLESHVKGHAAAVYIGDVPGPAQ